MGVNLEFVDTQFCHLLHVAGHMRDEDRAEVIAAGGKCPFDALIDGAIISDQCVTVLDPEGIPLVVFGIAPLCRLTGTGVPWMLGTKRAEKYVRNFITDAPKVIDIMMETYPRLENWVHIANRKSVRWLRLMGFNMGKPVTFPFSGEQFIRFHMSREN